MFSLLLGVSDLKAQSLDQKIFTLYTTKDGLSSDRVNDITQDVYGYIWIATGQGLNRFDGKNFQTFYSDSSSNSLPRDEIVKLKWLNKEQLAALTIGMHIKNIRTLESRNIIIPAGEMKHEYKVNAMQDILSDKDGNTFILTRSGFYHYNQKRELVFRYDHYTKENRETIFQFGRNMVMAENAILLATFRGLYIYDIVKKDLHPVNSSDDPFYRQIARPLEWFRFMHGNEKSFSVQMENATALFYYDIRNKKKYLLSASFPMRDKIDWHSRLFKLNDTLFAINGSEKGFYLVHYDRQSDVFTIKPTLYFENGFCSSICIDKDNRLWIGTNNGLLVEKKITGNVERMTIPPVFNPFSRDMIIRMIAVAKDRLFVASRKGLLVFDRSSMMPIKQIGLPNPRIGNNVSSVITINPDTIFATIDNNAAWVHTGNLNYGLLKLPSWDHNLREGIQFFKDSHGIVYLTFNYEDLYYYRPTPASGFNLSFYKANKQHQILIPTFISEDWYGNIWFSGQTGISFYNSNKGIFEVVLDSFPSIKMARREVGGLTFDKDGKIYFGLAENGLMIYDTLRKKVQQFSRSDGLPSNNIKAVYFHNNKVWLGTEEGIASYDILTGKIASFGISDNMPSERVTAGSFYFDSLYNHLYAGFNNTIVRFDPDKLIKNNLPPAFFIEGIKVVNKETIHHPTGKIELLHKHNSFVVNLASVNFEDAYLQQFAYRIIKEENEEWQEIGSQRSIIFSDLSPGMHKLQVKVFIRNNSWPEQVKEIMIYIRPPFWKTTWFILFICVLILAGLTVFFLYRIKRIRQKANIDRQLAELEMKGLHAQMNPHFIFNSLNSIKEMILEDEKQNASRYLSKFAQLIRTSLEQSRQTFISVKQCIDHLRQYLEMEKIRFDGFSYSIISDNELAIDEIQMSPMLIQPLVENAIWHGLQNKDGEKKLSIRFSSSGEQLICEIEDNGIGINQSKKNRSSLKHTHRSLGVTNIHERLIILNEKYKMNCSLTITDRSELPGHNESGTLAILRLSIKSNL